MERGYWIRSKPVYNSLAWHEKATAHLVIAQGHGGMAVLKLFHVSAIVLTLNESEQDRARALWIRKFGKVAESAGEKSKQIRYL